MDVKLGSGVLRKTGGYLPLYVLPPCTSHAKRKSPQMKEATSGISGVNQDKLPGPLSFVTRRLKMSFHKSKRNMLFKGCASYVLPLNSTTRYSMRGKAFLALSMTRLYLVDAKNTICAISVDTMHRIQQGQRLK